jgi:signal transduction histidine kinase
MFKNLLRIPDTFDPDDHRRRQVLNILLIVFMALTLLSIILALLTIYFDLDPRGSKDNELTVVPGIFLIVLCGILLLTNRSISVPGWLNGIVFLALLVAVLTQIDTPQQLYNGRSLMVWVLPIMIAALILHPGYAFAIAAFISGLIWFFLHAPNGMANYYSMIALFTIAFLCWLGMTIANRSIGDARRQAANLEAIFKSVAEGVLVLDSQGKLLSANPALLKMIPDEQLAKIIAKPLGKTVQWKRKTFSVTASPVPEVGTVAVLRDETRRNEIERARDALLATASHELRTPLAAVMNYLELLLMLSKQGKLHEAEFTEHLTRALENSKRLQHLVNDILDQAQIQAGVLELKNQPFDLRALLERTRQLLDVLIKEKNLSYQQNVELDVPAEIVGDAERLQQVLVNLIGNAIKFTNQGSIKVSVSIPQKNELYIQVADSGPGIPPEQLPDIFEAFRRGSNYAQRERQGAGLGLSIAKEIVTRMGGEIYVSSEPGVGSTFTFILPVEET